MNMQRKLSTAQRLERLGVFSDSTIGIVSDVAEQHKKMNSYEIVLKNAGIKPPIRFSSQGHKPTEVFDHRPTEHERSEATAMHFGFGNAFDPQNMYMLAVLARCLPNRRLMASGNPTSAGNHYNRLTLTQAYNAFYGRYSSVNDALLNYALGNHIETFDQIGGSYGAERALALAASPAFKVNRALIAEPATLVERKLIPLVRTFNSCMPRIAETLEEIDVPHYEAARMDGMGMPRYVLGMGRLSNIALGNGQKRNMFFPRAHDMLVRQSDLIATFAWGDKSELCVSPEIHDSTSALRFMFGEDRVHTLELPGLGHAFGVDPYVFAAAAVESMGEVA